MRGSKHWRLVNKVLRALDLILNTRLYIRIRLIVRLVTTSVYGRLVLIILLDGLWGWDESLLLTGSRHKGSCEIGELRASASISSCRCLVRLEIYYVIQVEVSGSEGPCVSVREGSRVRGERGCRGNLLLLVLMLFLHI